VKCNLSKVYSMIQKKNTSRKGRTLSNRAGYMYQCSDTYQCSDVGNNTSVKSQKCLLTKKIALYILFTQQGRICIC
jgi:hypothetical protein